LKNNIAHFTVNFMKMSKLSSEIISARNHAEMAKFVLDSIPGGVVTKAIEFLEGVINHINKTTPNKKLKSEETVQPVVKPSTQPAAKPSVVVNKPIVNIPPIVNKKVEIPVNDPYTSFLVNDSIDMNNVTLTVQIPDDTILLAYIIGASGANVISIGKKSFTRIQIEKPGDRGSDQKRHLFIMGSVKGVIKAYQLLQEHLILKGDKFPIGRPIPLSRWPSIILTSS
jgi:hypothetical protein